MKDERLYGLLDITALGDLDTPISILNWTAEIARVCRATEGRFMPAAICVYAPLLEAARKGIQDLPIPLAAVAGNFPSGKAEPSLKSIETRRAIDAGANEIDWVIDRGAALFSQGKSVFEEVCIAREACGPIPLKVILESGQIEDEALLYNMACYALAAGADFLKTSTGKIPKGATELAAQIFCTAIAKTNPTAGLKVSGGIRDRETAVRYLDIFESQTGKTAHSGSFRIGASALANDLLRSAGIAP
jgi:deoxyribose-phosphate aldolase